MPSKVLTDKPWTGNIVVHLSKELHTRLKSIAAYTGRTLGDLAASGIEDIVEDFEKRITKFSIKGD